MSSVETNEFGTSTDNTGQYTEAKIINSRTHCWFQPLIRVVNNN